MRRKINLKRIMLCFAFSLLSGCFSTQTSQLMGLTSSDYSYSGSWEGKFLKDEETLFWVQFSENELVVYDINQDKFFSTAYRVLAVGGRSLIEVDLSKFKLFNCKDNKECLSNGEKLDPSYLYFAIVSQSKKQVLLEINNHTKLLEENRTFTTKLPLSSEKNYFHVPNLETYSINEEFNSIDIVEELFDFDLSPETTLQLTRTYEKLVN